MVLMMVMMMVMVMVLMMEIALGIGLCTSQMALMKATMPTAAVSLHSAAPAAAACSLLPPRQPLPPPQ